MKLPLLGISPRQPAICSTVIIRESAIRHGHARPHPHWMPAFTGMTVAERLTRL